MRDAPPRARDAMANRSDRALLLRRFPFSESSLVARVLTRNHGRVHLVARGAFRPRSRYFALLDHFDTLELEWSANPKRELAELRAGEIARRRRALSRSLESYRAGLAMLELAELGSQPGQAEPELFDLLERSLDSLAEPEVDTSRAIVVFELGFLQNHGLAPALERCASCGREAPATAERRGGPVPRAAFSAGAGGRLCSACARSARASGRRVGTLPVDVLTTAAELLAGGLPPHAASREPAPADLLIRTRDFVERFLDYHLETRPRSQRAFLAAPNRNAPRETNE